MEATGSLPLPTVHAFVPCLKIFQDQKTGTLILIGPTSHVPVPEFPAVMLLSCFADFSSGHGSYLPGLELRDLEGLAVWRWQAVEAFPFGEPLFPHQVNLSDLAISVPRAGRYALALQLNGLDVAERSLWIGPREVFLP